VTCVELVICFYFYTCFYIFLSDVLSFSEVCVCVCERVCVGRGGAMLEFVH
jgi:hypothetical protein